MSHAGYECVQTNIILYKPNLFALRALPVQATNTHPENQRLKIITIRYAYCTKITSKQMNNKDSIFATCYCICSLFTNGAFIWSLIIHFSFQQREYCTAISNNFCSHWEYIILLSLHFASVGCNK